MDESQYRALLEEVRNDVAEAERTISELSNLEKYLLQKIGSGDGASARSSSKKSSAGRSSRPAEKSDEENADSSAGKRLAAGHISLQGHDATTDVSFRNLRIISVANRATPAKPGNENR